MTAPDLTEARDLAAMWQARAEAAEAERDGANERAATLEHQHAHAVETMERMSANVTRAEQDRDEARAIIAGRSEAPTQGEAEAHEKRGGTWLVLYLSGNVDRARISGGRVRIDGLAWDVAPFFAENAGVRVWPINASGSLCPWPVVP